MLDPFPRLVGELIVQSLRARRAERKCSVDERDSGVVSDCGLWTCDEVAGRWMGNENRRAGSMNA